MWYINVPTIRNGDVPHRTTLSLRYGGRLDDITEEAVNASTLTGVRRLAMRGLQRSSITRRSSLAKFDARQ
jgi:hypothetical protein